MTKQKKGGTPFGVWRSGKKRYPKLPKGHSFVCLTTLRYAAATSRMLVSSSCQPVTSFSKQQCDIMGLHSESSDSVPPLATCPARIPLCKHSRNTRGPAVREGKPLPLHLPSPVLFIQGRPSPMVWFVGWVFFPSVVTAAPPCHLSLGSAMCPFA